MSSGIVGKYITRSGKTLYEYSASWRRDAGTVRWQANAKVGDRIAATLSGTLEHVAADSDPMTLVTGTIERELERLPER